MDVWEDMADECEWCRAVVDRAALVHLYDPATGACDDVCASCDRRYWAAPLVVGADGTAYRDMGAE